MKVLFRILNEYMNNIKAFNDQVGYYTAHLDIIYNQYKGLVSDFDNIISNFTFNLMQNSDKLYILDNLDCGKII